MRFLSRLWGFFFIPPFTGLPFLVWGYFVAASFLHPDSQIWHSNLVDSDDYLYLVQAQDWLNGQSWFDGLQHRIDPPDGSVIHFSRLLNIPYGGTIAILLHWFPPQQAAIIMAAIFPLIYFALFLYAVKWVAALFVGKDWASLSAFVALFCMALMLQFTPGRVDHHGLEALLAVAALGCTVKMLETPLALRWAMAAGGFLAFALDIGLEILPVFFVICACIGLWATIKGREAARVASVFAAALFLSSIVLLLLEKPLDTIWAVSIQSFSIAYIVLTGLISLAMLATIPASRIASLPIRISTIAASGVFMAIVFLRLFPKFIGGPYGETDPEVEDIIMHHAAEAWPLRIGGLYAHSFFLPFLALLSSWSFLRSKDSASLWSKGLLISLLIGNLALSIFYQQRLMVYVESFSIILLVYFVKRAWLFAASLSDKMMGNFVRVFALLLVGPLTVILLPVFGNDSASATNLLLFPVQMTQKPCDQNGLFEWLQKHGEMKPRTVMATINVAAEILFRTPYSVVGAPFHMNVRGNLDAYHFFTAEDEDEAKSIIRRRHADLVIICENITNENFPFIEQLDDGDDIPDWLEPVSAPELGNIMLFKVKKN